MTYLTVVEWRCGGVAHSQKNCNHRPWSDWVVNIRQSWWRFLASESYFTAVQREYATPPHVHQTSRYITARDQFYQAFPVLVLQATNTGVKRWMLEQSHWMLKQSQWCDPQGLVVKEFPYSLITCTNTVRLVLKWLNTSKETCIPNHGSTILCGGPICKIYVPW